MEELFDIYDDNKNLTGRTEVRKKYFLNEGEYMLLVIALLETPDHKFLITRRSFDKKWAAGDWEIPGGGVHAGETSFEAVCREVGEEVGVDVSKADGGLVYSYKNVDLKRGDNYFTDIYHFVLPMTMDQVTLQKEETIDGKLAPMEEITEIAEGGHFLHYKRILEALAAEKQK